MNVYLLPGLGLSENYFDSLIFPSGCRVFAITLVQPQANESLADYAVRLMAKVEEGMPFVLVGMSFGGVLAQQMARIRKPEAIILMSTIGHSDELPWYFRAGHKARISRFISYKLLGQAIGLLRSTSRKKHQRLYDNETVSPGYLAWSLDKMLNWKPETSPERCFRVHGGKDRLLPCRYKKGMFVISKASHLLLPEKHREVSGITSAILSNLMSRRENLPVVV